MSYNVNVDNPTKLARIHTANGKASCRPRKKSPQNGHWIELIPTRGGAILEAKATGLSVERCKNCNP